MSKKSQSSQYMRTSYCLTFIYVIKIFRDPRYRVFEAGDTWLCVLPFFHMMGYLVQLLAFVMPITTIIESKFRPETYLSAIQSYRPTKLAAIPSLVMFLATYPDVDKYNISSLTQILCAGAAILSSVLIKTKQRLPFIEIRQMYGTTESSGFCLIHVRHSKEGNIGIPMPEVIVKVRHPETFETLGAFQYGELCFKGPMIMKCYASNELATRKAFDTDGFFCSGDLVYYDEDRNFFYVDRLKEIIKYKGFQVSPSELEQLLLTNSKIKDCAVVGIPDDRNGELPLAFIVKSPDQCLIEQEVVDFVAERISIHKRLYGGVRFIDEIPKSPSGKILRNHLKRLL